MQSLQDARILSMSNVSPGQKTVALALASMEETPWCAECNVSSARCRRDGGITTLSS